MAARATDPQPLARRRLAAFVWALIGGTCCALVSGFEPNLLEEGIELHVAQRLAGGERLYRDVLVFTGPLPFELLALLFRAFGEEIWVARGVVAALHAGASGAAFALAAAARPGVPAHAAAAAVATAPLLLFPLFGIYYYTTIAFHLSLVAAWAVLRGLETARWAALAGVLVAAIALCKQTLGLSFAVAFGVALLSAAGRTAHAQRIAAFAAGGAGVAVGALAFWAATGALGATVFGMVTLPASLGDTFELPLPNLWPPGELRGAAAGSQTFYLPYFYLLVKGVLVEPSARAIGITQLLFALPLIAVLAALLRTGAALARRSAAAPALVVHAALLFGWLPNLAPRADWGHLAHVLPVAVSQLLVALPAPAPPRRWRRVAVGALASAAFLALALGAAAAAYVIDAAADPGPLAPRVPLRPVSSPLREAHVRRVIDFLARHAAPGEAIFVPRAEPLLYFATGTRNPTPYPGVFPAMREEQQRDILEALAGVRYVVMSDVDQPAMTYYREELPAVQEYLERHFEAAAPFADSELHWLTVLERVPDRGVPLVDLFARAKSGRPFVRDETGALSPAPAFDERLGTRRNRRPLAFRLGEGGGGIDFELELPERALFLGDVSLGGAFSERQVYRTPPYSRFVVSVGDGETWTPLAERTLERGWSQRWLPLEADLSAWAGRRVTLRLEMFRSQDVRKTRIEQIGCIGSPRIVRAPENGAAAATPSG
jgi:hypothetical protein